MKPTPSRAKPGAITVTIPDQMDGQRQPVDVALSATRTSIRQRGYPDRPRRMNIEESSIIGLVVENSMRIRLSRFPDTVRRPRVASSGTKTFATNRPVPKRRRRRRGQDTSFTSVCGAHDASCSLPARDGTGTGANTRRVIATRENHHVRSRMSRRKGHAGSLVPQR